MPPSDCAASSANIASGGVGFIRDGLFIGSGTPLGTNLTNDDVSWEYSGNYPIQDTAPGAIMYLHGNTTATKIAIIIIKSTWKNS